MITPDTTDEQLEANARDGSTDDEGFQRLLAKFTQWRETARAHSTEEPTGLREQLNLD